MRPLIQFQKNFPRETAISDAAMLAGMDLLKDCSKSSWAISCKSGQRSFHSPSNEKGVLGLR
jgi:hypothetical protein